MYCKGYEPPPPPPKPEPKPEPKPDPTPIIIDPTPQPIPNPPNLDDNTPAPEEVNDGTAAFIGMIVGAVIGGIFVLLLLIFVCMKLGKKCISKYKEWKIERANRPKKPKKPKVEKVKIKK